MALDETQVVDSASDTAEIPAVSQPGDDAVPVPVVEGLTGRQREKWLKEPAEYPRKPRKEEAAPKVSQPTDKAGSSPVEPESPESDEPAASSPAPSPEKVETAETAAASAPAESTQVEGKQPSEAEKRIKSLLSDNKLLKQKLSQYERPAPKLTEKFAEVPSDLQRPDPKKFDTPEEYFEALSDYKVELKVRDIQQKAAKEYQDRQIQMELEQFNVKVTNARKKYPDFDEVAMDPDLPIIENSPADRWIMKRPNGTDVWRYLGQNRDQLIAINQMTPEDANFELAQIEIKLSAPPKPAPLPRAPRPPSEANPTGKVDPLAAALQAGDFSTYHRLKDAEERKGRS